MDEQVKCPSCGADLVLKPASEGTGESPMPSVDEAQKMPLAQLRSKLPKKAE